MGDGPLHQKPIALCAAVVPGAACGYCGKWWDQSLQRPKRLPNSTQALFFLGKRAGKWCGKSSAGNRARFLQV